MLTIIIITTRSFSAFLNLSKILTLISRFSRYQILLAQGARHSEFIMTINRTNYIFTEFAIIFLSQQKGLDSYENTTKTVAKTKLNVSLKFQQ